MMRKIFVPPSASSRKPLRVINRLGLRFMMVTEFAAAPICHVRGCVCCRLVKALKTRKLDRAVTNAAGYCLSRTRSVRPGMECETHTASDAGKANSCLAGGRFGHRNGTISTIEGER